MKPKAKVISSCVAFATLLLVLVMLLLRDRAPAIIDLRDGSQLQIVHVSVGTNHTAHFGNPFNKLLFKFAGARLSPKWVGYRMVTAAQDSIDGNLGIFVHHVRPADMWEYVHTYTIKPVTQPRKEHPMFLTSAQGGYGLWELNYWNQTSPSFLVENSKGEVVGRFNVTRDEQGRYKVLLDPSPPKP
jgi:hypothetical protein